MGVKKNLLIIMLAIALVIIAYGVKKAHLQNYWKGENELKTLRKRLSLDNIRSQKFKGFAYIAHAGGGLNQKSYLNTLEAVNHSYSLGVNFIELDFHYTADSAVVLSHDFVNVGLNQFLNDNSTGTHLSINDLMKWLSDKDVWVITDIKVNNVKILKAIRDDYPETFHKIIPQVYGIPEILVVKNLGYKKMIFTNYASSYPNVTIKKLSEIECLFAITLPYDINFKMLEGENDFDNFRTPIFTHTVNDADITKRLIKSGCKGIYTDFLLAPSLIN